MKKSTGVLSAAMFVLMTATLTSCVIKTGPESSYKSAAELTSGSDDLEMEFLSPSETSKPWVFWYWMRANATAEGITRDLEAMAETGIGGANQAKKVIGGT